MKTRFTLLTFLLYSGLIFSQNFLNVPIDTVTGSGEEPSICINPKNTNYIVAAENISYYFYSSDGGLTWSSYNNLTSTYGVYGDPCITTDTAGNFYYTHLAYNNSLSGWNKLDRIVVQKSTNNGASFSNGSFVGHNNGHMQDKAWVACDFTNSPYKNNLYIAWTQFDSYASSLSTDSSLIYFASSSDGGNTWTPDKRLCAMGGDCIDSDNTVEGAVPAVGPNGEIYISWVGTQGIVFNKSLDGGTTWLPVEQLVTTVPGGWDYAISGIYRSNGLPVTLCDVSGTATNGNIYINWTDQRNGATDTDVWIVKSADGGSTWSAPIRVNNDAAGKQQFMSWMTIDQSTGYLYSVFYDRRNYSGDTTDVYLAWSTDGGTTFSNVKISQNYFKPYNNVFIGDYTNISAVNGMVRPIWTRHDYSAAFPSSGITSVWTAIIDYNSLVSGIKENAEAEPQILIYPQPAADVLNVFLPEKILQKNISLSDIKGKEIKCDITFSDSGFSVNTSGLRNGIYFLNVKCKSNLVQKKIVIAR